MTNWTIWLQELAPHLIDCSIARRLLSLALLQFHTSRVGTTSWSLPLHAMHSLKIHSFQFQDSWHQFSLILRLCVQRRALNSLPPGSFPLNSFPSKVFTFYLQGNCGSFWKRIWDFWCINVHLIRWLYDYAIVLTSTIQFFICCAILAQLLHSH